LETLGIRGGDDRAELGADGTSAFVWIEETDKGSEDRGACIRDATSCDV
jgi:hypothetical protein